MDSPLRPTPGYRAAKVLDIGYVGAVYILLAFGIGVILNNNTPRFDPVTADRRSWWSLLAEVVLHFWVLNVLVYAVRKMVEVLPWPARVCFVRGATEAGGLPWMDGTDSSMHASPN